MVNAIGRFFLRAKAWQVFVIVVGLYSVGELCSIATSVQVPGVASNQAVLVLGAVCRCGVFLWLWLLGSCLVGMVPPDEKHSGKSLSIAGGICIAYLMASAFVRGPRTVGFMAFLALIAVICMLYMVDFVAASLLAAESRRMPRFREYAKPFFLLLLFPLGIWLVQPRLNKLYDGKRRKDRRATAETPGSARGPLI